MNGFVIAVPLLLFLGAPTQSSEPSTLVAESGAKYSFKDGVLELRGGRGWLQTSRPYLNFMLSFDFKANDA